MDAEMEMLIESISQSGVITPVIARAVGDDKYEIVSGHRRKFACDFLNIDTVPVVVRELDMNECTPSYAQSIRLGKAFQAGELNKDKIFEILAEYKPNQLDHIRFRTDDIRKYFPRDYTDSQMQQTIIKLLDAWQKKRERNTREDR